MVIKPIVPAVPLLVCIGLVFAVLCVRTVLRRGDVPLKCLLILRTAALLSLAAVIALRPMKEAGQMDVEMKNIDVLFVIDNTVSMYAEDYRGNSQRMTGALQDCLYLMRQLQGANFAVIRFDNRSRILTPFTQDMETAIDVLDMISEPDSSYAAGSSLNTPYDDMEMLLTSSSKKQDRQTVVFFMSDGEITDGSSLRSFAALGALVDNGAVLGYGTAEGGPMKENPGYGYIYALSTGEKALSVLDEETLNTLAGDLGISYMHMDGTVTLDHQVEQIMASSRSTMGKKNVTVYEDIYWYFAIPLVLLLALELALFIRRDRL